MPPRFSREHRERFILPKFSRKSLDLESKDPPSQPKLDVRGASIEDPRAPGPDCRRVLCCSRRAPWKGRIRTPEQRLPATSMPDAPWKWRGGSVRIRKGGIPHVILRTQLDLSMAELTEQLLNLEPLEDPHSRIF